MDLVSIFFIAVALAMDAFSVCVSCGITIPKPGPGHYVRLAFSFGLFQFMMPVIGFFGGMYLEQLHQVIRPLARLRTPGLHRPEDGSGVVFTAGQRRMPGG